ncbi:PilZ domain-containing protein [Kurthia sibirica]|uniref:PilZ domain-containing protein n=1 Tax=Kurthia sibirica TaxID=202750 RepID=UPI00116ED13A|nr:PilZ domain-containing protein [Kurthia sibirica]GEK33631.1 hypothetical protein KSI01_11640 [Kurthia sibirica]
MDYKRAESFRHILLEEVDVEFTCMIEQVAITTTCKIVDISPSGISFFTLKEIPESSMLDKMDFSFVLYKKTIQSEGVIRWKKYFAEGLRYGVELEQSERLETLIIEELKLRRKQEVLNNKKK